jgi:hypothetical protein
LFGSQTTERVGNVILGCDKGTLIVLDVVNPPRTVLVFGKLHVQDSKAEFPDTLREKKVLSLPLKDEPITHIIEVTTKKES